MFAQVLLLHHLVQNQGAFSLDACYPFPQHVLAIVPLIWDAQVQWPLRASAMV